MLLIYRIRTIFLRHFLKMCYFGVMIKSIEIIADHREKNSRHNMWQEAIKGAIFSASILKGYFIMNAIITNEIIRFKCR